MVKSNLPPCIGTVALKQLNSIHKKEAIKFFFKFLGPVNVPETGYDLPFSVYIDKMFGEDTGFVSQENISKKLLWKQNLTHFTALSNQEIAQLKVRSIMQFA